MIENVLNALDAFFARNAILLIEIFKTTKGRRAKSVAICAGRIYNEDGFMAKTTAG